MAMNKKEFCEFYEELLRAQLSVVRQFSGQEARRRRTVQKGKSQVGITEDILRAAEQFDATIDRESLVSALTKKIRKGDRFVRVAPNTFALAMQSEH
jgi:hypothetical protein